MSKVFLFERGENGSLVVDAQGVRAAPRFAPEVLAHLRAIADLLRAGGGAVSSGPTADLNMLVTKVANLAVERIEAAIGSLDETDSLIYLDANDGFICGSTGAPPRPIQWPPLGGSAPTDLIATGVLAPDLIEFLRRSRKEGLKLAEMLEDPTKAADRLGVKLSAVAAGNLQQLAPSKIEYVSDPVAREVIGFFHHVIDDGRFIETWVAQPKAVAASLGIDVSNAAVDKILGSSAIVGRVSDVANLSIEQGVVIVVVAIIVLDQKIPIENVIDRSGRTKF